ncbi:MAG TPA: hypothetical protein VLG17_20335, partial [Pseudomonas sp.]|uniref:hypothetical protein n=1 Tax=Pseudomonas sp. TaxID=306 RepID=UPI002BAADB0E
PLGEQAAVWLEGGASVAQALNRLAGASPARLAAGALSFVQQDALPQALVNRTGFRGGLLA